MSKFQIGDKVRRTNLEEDDFERTVVESAIDPDGAEIVCLRCERDGYMGYGDGRADLLELVPKPKVLRGCWLTVDEDGFSTGPWWSLEGAKRLANRSIVHVRPDGTWTWVEEET